MMHKKINIIVLLIGLCGLAACNSGGSSSTTSSTSNNDYQLYTITANTSTYTCSSSGGLVVATLVESFYVSPAAYIQIASGTTLNSGITMATSASCTTTATNTPSCTYVFSYSNTTPQQTVQIQLNGAPGISNLNTVTVGGSCNT